MFRQYLMKIYIQLYTVQLKSMKWKLSQDIFIDKISFEKNHKIENSQFKHIVYNIYNSIALKYHSIAFESHTI